MDNWRRTLAAATVAQFMSMVGFSFVLPFLPFYLVQELGIAAGPVQVKWASVLASATGATMAIFAPMWGRLADRHGRKMMVLRAMYGGAIVIALMGFVRSPWQLLFLRLLQGALTGTMGANMALVSSVTPVRRSGFALGIVQASAFAGTSLGPLLGSMTAYHWGFRSAFFIAGGMLLLGGLLVHTGAEERFTPAPDARKGRASYRELLMLGGFLTVILAQFQVQFANTAPGPVFPLMVQTISRVSTLEATRKTGAILASAAVAAAIGSVIIGRFGDRLGHKRILVVCACLAATAIAPQPFVNHVAYLYVLRVIFGFAVAGMVPSALAIMRRITPKDKIGTAFGITAAMSGVAFATGPLVGGYLAAAAGAFWPPFLLSAAILVAVAFMAHYRITAAAEPDVPSDEPA